MGLVADLLSEHQLPPDGEWGQRLVWARRQLGEELSSHRLSARVERQLLAGLLDRLLAVRNLGASTVPTSGGDDGLPAPGRLAAPGRLSVLADRLSAQWLAHVLNVWRRLQQDAERISKLLGVRMGVVCSVNMALGDRHRGGQAVTELTLDTGVSLIYKPRSVALEAFFSPLLQLIGTDALSFRGLDVIEGDGYGWVRKVQPQPCTSAEELGRFHERLGGLLAIAFAFGATDLHEDNLIAVGEHPVLIDLETLLAVELPGAGLAEQLQYSVFDVGLLPAWLPGPEGHPVLSGGIGGGLTASGAFGGGTLAHVPRLGSGLVSPLDYQAEVVCGFQLASRRLVELESEVLALSQTIRGASYRCVLRPTRHYARALSLAWHSSAALPEGAFRDRLRECLPPLARDDGSGRAFEAELSGLAALDIPYFSGTVAHASLYSLDECSLDDEREVMRLPAAPWDLLQRRLSERSERDLAHQARNVGAAFAAARAHQRRDPPLGAAASRLAQARPVALPASNGADAGPLAVACAIGADLEAMLCRTRDGGATWLQPRYWQGTGVWQVGRTDIDFATGRAGLAVFFAALAHCSDQAQHRILAQECLRWQQPLRAQLLADPVNAPAGPYGALVYSLVLCGQLLRCPELMAAARELALLVPESALQGDLAVWTGHAGMVLGLLALAETMTDKRAARDVLERALSFGRHVTAQPDLAGSSSGFGYGAEGLRFALRRLTEALARAGLEAAPEFVQGSARGDGMHPTAIAIPPCPTGEHDSESGMCNGRLGLTVAAALTDWAAEPPDCLLAEREAELDLLCCGNAGLIDISLELGQRWPALLRAGKRRLAALRVRTSSSAEYRLRLSPELQRPGLFDGLAGIGFMWLRQHDPRLPCVLLWNTLRS